MESPTSEGIVEKVESYRRVEGRLVYTLTPSRMSIFETRNRRGKDVVNEAMRIYVVWYDMLASNGHIVYTCTLRFIFFFFSLSSTCPFCIDSSERCPQLLQPSCSSINT